MSIVRDPAGRRLAVPEVEPPAADVAALRAFLDRHQRVFVLTGAGCSTESGIPDYRGLDGEWKRQRPIELPAVRARPVMRAALLGTQPDRLAQFRQGRAERRSPRPGRGRAPRSGRAVVTQNVDGLHQAAGSRRVIDLHGRLDRVACLACRQTTATGRLAAAPVARSTGTGPGSTRRSRRTATPTSTALDFSTFVVPACPRCGGVVKPDVVFFGENVPPWRHTQATAALSQSDAMLVVGSSLMVHSGYRYALAAAGSGCRSPPSTSDAPGPTTCSR